MSWLSLGLVYVFFYAIAVLALAPFARSAGIPLLHKPFSAIDLDTVLRALAISPQPS